MLFRRIYYLWIISGCDPVHLPTNLGSFQLAPSSTHNSSLYFMPNIGHRRSSSSITQFDKPLPEASWVKQGQLPAGQQLADADQQHSAQHAGYVQMQGFSRQLYRKPPASQHLPEPGCPVPLADQPLLPGQFLDKSLPLDQDDRSAVSYIFARC